MVITPVRFFFTSRPIDKIGSGRESLVVPRISVPIESFPSALVLLKIKYLGFDFTFVINGNDKQDK